MHSINYHSFQSKNIYTVQSAKYVFNTICKVPFNSICKTFIYITFLEVEEDSIWTPCSADPCFSLRQLILPYICKCNSIFILPSKTLSGGLTY